MEKIPSNFCSNSDGNYGRIGWKVLEKFSRNSPNCSREAPGGIIEESLKNLNGKSCENSRGTSGKMHVKLLAGFTGNSGRNSQEAPGRILIKMLLEFTGSFYRNISENS